MSLQRYLEKIRHLDALIARKSTGNQRNLARKLEISVSTLNEYLHFMKEAGFPIKYSRKRESYYYEKNGQMVHSLFQETLTNDEMRSLKGGCIFPCNFIFHSDYIRGTHSSFACITHLKSENHEKAKHDL
jgi:biotin operon repressor